MKVNKYFDIKELVSSRVYNKYGDNAVELLNSKALKMLENVREILDVPLICNNWAAGGNRNYCGYREPECTIGAKGSFHRKALAFDLISKYMTAAEMRDKLEQNQDKLIYPIRVEKWDNKGEINWLHIDISPNTHGKKLYFFRT